ncbi:hypothetical protein CK510_12525 [Brunnivagina elsteri CCALA 953]|uniref:Uncharacterized protein n=1 Tax=Brunnivagina elsteri CCALA 953 TaxID=987040 RepID=A0A2A2TJ54_9CYAN|nr:hypothetical protein CK510_12525 [Calothrix elsteri CCALA 953]
MENNRNREEVFSQSLVKAGLISEEQLHQAVKQHQVHGKHLEEVLVEQGLVKPETIIYLKENFMFSETKNDTYNPNNFDISISAKQVFGIMLRIICFLVSTFLITQLVQRFAPDFFLRDGLALLFNLDEELNFPSVYSSFALLFAAIILGFIAYMKNSQQDFYTSYWKWLSITFSFLFFDELVSVHEHMIEPMKTLFNTKGFLSFAWVIPGSIGVLILFLVFLKFIINLPQKTRSNFLIAGAIYIAGCIGCELVGGYIVDNKLGFMPYLIEVTLEEFLEMLGIAIFIYGLFSHISYYGKGVIFKIQIPSKKLRLFN